MNKKLKKYLTVCTAVFLTFAACMFLFFSVFKIHEVAALLLKIANILEPILIGIIIAFLLNPVMNFCEKYVYRIVEKSEIQPDEKKRRALARGISIFLSLMFGVFIVVSVFGLMVPQLLKSIYGIAREMPGHINDLSRWMIDLSRDYPALEEWAVQIMQKITGKLNDWFSYDLLIYVTKYLGYLTTGVISAVSTLFNIVIGMIIAVYVLHGREVFAGQAKKIIYALFSPGKANVILHTARKSYDIFSGFITGKILDSAIIGILCFICLSIMKMPYTLLVSVIVGVTNVIPFFGPYIGAIPSAIIILLVNPLQAVYFLIFILILQQIDGNIIGPSILGESTGLSAFWVVFAILFGGGLFGIPGMIIGVPTFAVIYYIVKTYINLLLQRKEFPTGLKSYIRLKMVDTEDQELIYYKKGEIEAKRSIRKGKKSRGKEKKTENGAEKPEKGIK